jgi:hypothetical protein
MTTFKVSPTEIEHRAFVSGGWLTVHGQEMHLRIGSTLYVAPLGGAR